MPKSERLPVGKAFEEGLAIQHVAETEAQKESREVEGRDYDQLSRSLDILKKAYPELAKKFIEMNAGLKKVKDEMGAELWNAYLVVEKDLASTVVVSLGRMYLGRVKKLSQKKLNEKEFAEERGKLRVAFIEACIQQITSNSRLRRIFQGKEDLLHKAVALEIPAMAQEIETLDY